MNERILANLKTALVTVGEANEERYTRKIVDDELWDGLKRDFQRSILYQLKRDRFGNHSIGNSISYSYRLKEPFKRFFNDFLFKRLVSETFGWSAHWRFIEPDTICIDSRKAIQAFQILYEKYSQEPGILERNEFIKEFDLREMELEAEQEEEEEFEISEDILSLQQHIKKFHNDCVFHTDELQEPHSIPSLIAFYMFYYYINYETDGQHPDIKPATVIRLLNKELRKYEKEHVSKSGKSIKKIKNIHRIQYYMNMQILTPSNRWYPENKRIQKNKEPVRVNTISMADRIKRRKMER